MREWYVSDGVHGAEAILLHRQDTPAEALSAGERVVDTVSFAAPR